MSDSEHSTVTYTSVSILVEDDSDIGSPGIDGPPIMPEDPYAYIMAAYQVPPSPDYIPGPEEPQSPPPLDFPLPAAASHTADLPGNVPESDPEEDDEDPEEDPANYPANRDDDDDDDEDEDEDEEEEEEHPAPADSVPPVHRMTARISIRDEPSISLPPREEVERLLALTTPPPSPLTPLSSPLPQIPSPPLPIPSPPPNSPTHIKIPESCLPLRKRVRFSSPTPSHEVGESSAAGAARQDRPAVPREGPYSIARRDLYGFIDMVDVAPGHPMSRELDYGITDTWDDLVGAIDEIAPTTLEGVNQRVTDLATIVEQETTIMYGIMEDARDDRSQLRGRVNLLYRDRPVHRRLAVMIEREAKIACEAWGLSMDASDYARSDVMSLRTTVVAQSALISELQSADHRRQRVISELLASDHKRQVQLTKTLRLLKGLQTQMTTTPEAAHAMPWRTLKKIMTGKYCPRGEIKKLEFEMWNLKVKGNDVVPYSQRFQELALMCDRMFLEEIDQVEKYVGGLPDTIHGSVMATKPKTMQDAIEFATELMDKKINTWAELQADNKRKSDDTARNNQNQKPNKRQNTGRAYAARNGDRRPYKGPRPLCSKCNYQHEMVLVLLNATSATDLVIYLVTVGIP
ncbi:putative reverse transcriptase domain-containing protein [Tanacetum coccineum]